VRVKLLSNLVLRLTVLCEVSLLATTVAGNLLFLGVFLGDLLVTTLASTLARVVLVLFFKVVVLYALY
jgi:hypothetical protein